MDLKVYKDAQAWLRLETQISACTACPLHVGIAQKVVERGSRTAPLMVIGEGPGAEEDRLGQPFVGASGKLLSTLLEGAGFAASELYFCNIVKCRPPNNRAPSRAEADRCLPFLRAQVALLAPRAILLLGASAYRFYTGDKTPISKVRGQGREGTVFLMPSFHPAYLLRCRSKVPLFQADLAQLRAKLAP